MGAPVFNTSFVGQGTRTAKNPMTSPQTGGLHDIMSKGKQMYGAASTAYGVYRAAKDAYSTARGYWPMIRQGLQGLEMIA